MLTLKFSHRYAKMPILGRMEGLKTFMDGYTIVNKLSRDFIRLDTKYYDNLGDIEKAAKFDKISETGPYLILFLRTIDPNNKLLVWRWTTVKNPWRRKVVACYTCNACQTCSGAKINVGSCFSWRPIISAKYPASKGKEVKIIIEG